MTLTRQSLATPEPVLPEQGAWTYEDYSLLPNDGWRYEVIKGVLYMAPAPNTNHQHAIGQIEYELFHHVKRNDLGRVYLSPIDVILPGLASPVQPDILFIAKERLPIITKQTIDGAPDLVIEVLSPATLIHDRRIKYKLYEEAGVKEYWIVDVDQSMIEVFALTNGIYTASGRYGSGETAFSSLLDGFSVAVDSICTE